MKTDYSKLKLVECAMIMVAFFGLSILAVESYLAMPAKIQNSIALTSKLFDISAKAQDEAEILSFGYESLDKFYQEFYLAFENVASAPDAVMAVEKKMQKTRYIKNDAVMLVAELQGRLTPSAPNTGSAREAPMVLGLTIDNSYTQQVLSSTKDRLKIEYIKSELFDSSAIKNSLKQLKQTINNH